MANHSDFIVYVDESGDHGLKGIDPQFPMFCLSFCLIDKSKYVDEVVPAFQRFKFDFWGHDSVVLHEHEIRKSKGDFAFLRTDPELRGRFFDRLNALMADAPISIYPTVINKQDLVDKYPNPWNPYEVAMYLCLERVLRRLVDEDQAGKTVHVVFESRGNREDRELEVEFRRVCGNASHWGWKRADFSQVTFEPIFMSKAANSTGLQLADLTARPIALSYLRPGQENRAMEILGPKICAPKSFP
ncbi:MAG: DUF3800 domain-containing protein [Alphaproteobacteria bacterium]|nr:DUF3800 domain-containing protein [Alphaproteobacteria bacterium]